MISTAKYESAITVNRSNFMYGFAVSPTFSLKVATIVKPFAEAATVKL